jgi:TRAP-type mannitol/chloroaromatic compound transport system permease small subunit
MKRWLGLAAAIDRVSRFFGWIAAWLVLLSALISAGNAASRYLFSLSSNAWLEIQWQMFAGIFLLGAPWVLKLNEHVRVDLLYGSASPRRKLWIDALGIPLFLFPTTLVMAWYAWPFFLASYRGNEMSSNAGGLLVWPVKFLLPFGLVLLFAQGVAELIKRIAGLRGYADESVEYERPLQ